MNRKIPIHELAEQVAEACSISKEAAEAFIRSFFDLVAECVTSGEVVKVKGIGVFAASGKADNPVEFTPDKSLADTINAPFALFEPEPLTASVTPEALEEAGRIAEEEVSVSIPEQDAQPEENAEIETEPDTGQETESVESTAPVTTPVTAPSAQVETEAEEEVEDKPAVSVAEPVAEVEMPQQTEPEPAPEPEPEPEPAPEPKPEPTPEPEPIAEPKPEPKPVAATPVVKPTPQVLTPPVFIDEDPEEPVETGERESGGLGFGWGFLFGMLAGLALGACGVYFAINYFFPMPTRGGEEQIEAIEAIEVQADSIAAAIVPVADSVVMADTVATPKAVAENKAPAPAGQPAVQTAPKPEVVKDKIRAGYLIHEMAKKHYGSKAFWVYIYEENKSKIGNPNKLQAGLELVIPPAEKYGINASDPSSVKTANEKAARILAKYPR